MMLKCDPDKKMALVVDDDPLFCFSIAMSLKMAGYEVLEASNGRWALEIIETERRKEREFDLFIIDLLMPVMDGMQLIHEIRKTNLPGSILAVSGSIDADVSRELKAIGCSHWLAKPFIVSQLMNAVRQTEDRGV